MTGQRSSRKPGLARNPFLMSAKPAYAADLPARAPIPASRMTHDASRNHILANGRAIEIRTNRIATETRARCSFQTPAQFRGDDFAGHCRAERRFLISAEISSMGVPRPGCLSASSARPICSGIRSGSYPSSARLSFSLRASSSRSSIGRALSASNNSVALMKSNYRPKNF